MKVELPIAEFLCSGCRDSERDAVWHLPSLYIRFDVPVPKVEGTITVSVDIESIIWKRSDVGVYAAFARIRIICPCCESAHEIQQHVHACRIVVSASAACGKCGGPLRLDQDEIEYSGGPADNPLVTIRANLICCTCRSPQVKRSTAVTVGEMLNHGSDIEVVVDDHEFYLRPNRSEVVPR